MYTAPLKGALFVICCGTGSGFAIGSATEHEGDKSAKRLQSAYCRIMFKVR
jgi:hypothetical protein